MNGSKTPCGVAFYFKEYIMAFGYIFVGIVIALYGVAFMEAHGWPWLKKFNKRREQTDILGVLTTMSYDDHQFTEWLVRKRGR